jgi:hypothetical protein
MRKALTEMRDTEESVKPSPKHRARKRSDNREVEKEMELLGDQMVWRDMVSLRNYSETDS